MAETSAASVGTNETQSTAHSEFPVGKTFLSLAQRASLLGFARSVMQSTLTSGPSPLAPTDLLLNSFQGGVFVSLHHGQRLRGCVGRIEAARQTIVEVTQAMASAVLDDPRFVTCPVTAGELDRLTIELSVLSAMTPTRNPLEMQAGVHGLYIQYEGRSGCFLPQVATHMNWDAARMLSHCCADKMGLPLDAWRDPAAEIYLFTAEVFSEPSR